ncbi:MAG: B3/4 domain-containing protein [Saprospiraceae bacterium]
MMPIIQIDPKVKAICPDLSLLCLQAEVEVVKEHTALWQTIDQTCETLRSQYQQADLAKRPSIQSARLGYKALGKEPSRYRLSAEALLRRVVNGKGLYKVCNVVDILNLISIKTGYSIGGYDADQIQGSICLGHGQKAEAYAAIGRGALNIENLPVCRDELGAFGNPTSDSERTMVTNDTQNFLMVFFHFGATDDFEELIALTSELLQRFAKAKNIQHQIID